MNSLYLYVYIYIKLKQWKIKSVILSDKKGHGLFLYK